MLEEQTICSPFPATIRIGQGEIRARVEEHRRDPAIRVHQTEEGRLFVTWASVPAVHRNGVERFLVNYYKPLVGHAFPNVALVEVNLVA